MSQSPNPSFPPVEPEPIIELAEPPKWPSVVGGVSVGWAALGLGCTGCGALSLVMGLQPPSDQAPPTTMTPPMIAHMAVGTLNGVLLLIAGIVTCMRRPAGRSLHLTYAGISIPLLIIGIFLQLQAQAAMQQWMQDHPDSQAAQMMNSGFGKLMMSLGLILSVVLGAPWPIFCLIWFGLVKRRPSDMTGESVE